MTHRPLLNRSYLLIALLAACTPSSQDTPDTSTRGMTTETDEDMQGDRVDGKGDAFKEPGKSITQAFMDCHDYINADGEPLVGVPKDSSTLYRIIGTENGHPYLEAIDDIPAGAQQKVFTIVNENARFTTYKCWSSPDTGSMLTGFDAQLITELLAPTRYEYLRVEAIPWTTWVASPSADFDDTCAELWGKSKNDVEADHTLNQLFETCAAQGHAEYQLSIIAAVNLGLGDAALAGMSVNAERLGWADMVGPIYKAGKAMVSRHDNTRVSARAEALQTIPAPDVQDLCARYEPMRGLSVIEDAANIRGEFLMALHDQCPGLVNLQTIGISINDGVDSADDPEAIRAQNLASIRAKYQHIKETFSEDVLTFIVVEDFPMIESFVYAGMVRTSEGPFDEDVDMVMIDTGSAFALRENGVLGTQIEEITGNIGRDQTIGHIFGLGDGIAVTREDPETSALLTARLQALDDEGVIAELVERWFKDDNAADTSCIGRVESCL